MRDVILSLSKDSGEWPLRTTLRRAQSDNALVEEELSIITV
jgi:hypothetical protein